MPKKAPYTLLECHCEDGEVILYHWKHSNPDTLTIYPTKMQNPFKKVVISQRPDQPFKPKQVGAD